MVITLSIYKNMNALKVLAAISLTVLVGCKNAGQKQTTTSEVKTENIDSTKTEYCGIYEGTLPCADCEGIKTTLTVNEDTTYELRSEYLGKKDNNVFEECGVYNILNEDIIELITPSSGVKTYYKILENAVALSDSEGNLNEGELAEYYILKKQ